MENTKGSFVSSRLSLLEVEGYVHFYEWCCSQAWDLGLVGCEYRVIFADTLGRIEREEVAGPVVEGMKSQMKEEVVEGRMLAWGLGAKMSTVDHLCLKNSPAQHAAFRSLSNNGWRVEKLLTVLDTRQNY